MIVFLNIKVILEIMHHVINTQLLKSFWKWQYFMIVTPNFKDHFEVKTQIVTPKPLAHFYH